MAHAMVLGGHSAETLCAHNLRGAFLEVLIVGCKHRDYQETGRTVGFQGLRLKAQDLGDRIYRRGLRFRLQFVA